MNRRAIPLEQFRAELKAQDVPLEHCTFVCPMCKTLQSAADLIAAGAGQTFDDVERYLAFSCVGRFTGAKPHIQGQKGGEGCDWTLGGLFQIHTLEVVTPDGVHHPRFELATPAEAQRHMNI